MWDSSFKRKLAVLHVVLELYSSELRIVNFKYCEFHLFVDFIHFLSIACNYVALLRTFYSSPLQYVDVDLNRK